MRYENAVGKTSLMESSIPELKNPKKFDLASSVLLESHNSLMDNVKVNFLKLKDYKEILDEDSAWNLLTTSILSETSTESRDILEGLFKNTRAEQRMQMFHESGMSGLHAISTLSLPMQRKAFPKIGIKEAIPPNVATKPQFNIQRIHYFYVDPITKQPIELPDAFENNTVNSSQPSITNAFLVLPLENYDIMPPSSPISAGYTLDKKFAVSQLKVTCTDAAGAAPEVKIINAYTSVNDGYDPNFRIIKFTAKAIHSSGHVTYDTILGEVDLAKGTITVMNYNLGAASQDKAKIIEVSFKGKVDTSRQKQTTEVTITTSVATVNIGTSELIQANIEPEWARDFAAMYSIDVSMQLIDTIAEVMAEKTDIAGRDFLINEYDVWKSIYGNGYERTFNFHPTGQFTGSPSEWIAEIRRVIENLAETVKQRTNIYNGYWACAGNQIDISAIPALDWSFSSGGHKDGVTVDNYSLAAQSSGGNKYVFFCSKFMPRNTIYFYFIPSSKEYATYEYYIYSLSVSRTTEGFANAIHPTVPAILMNKRDLFISFQKMAGKLNIMNNNGTLPPNPTAVYNS